MARKPGVSSNLINLTEGFFSSIADLSLFFIYFGIGFGTTLGSKGQAAAEGLNFADETLPKINYKSIKRSIYNLKRRGLIKYIKRELVTSYHITQEGINRISSILPQYNSKRSWDDRVYLITYDIPETKIKKRDKFRNFLKRLKCAYLQNSVWLTCYNPKKLVSSYVEENQIPGQILISDLGPDGSVGDQDIKSLLEEIYQLESLNFQYKEFLKIYKKKKNLRDSSKQQAALAFLKILDEDPQIPWGLLPDDWMGDKAYLFYKKLL